MGIRSVRSVVLAIAIVLLPVSSASMQSPDPPDNDQSEVVSQIFMPLLMGPAQADDGEDEEQDESNLPPDIESPDEVANDRSSEIDPNITFQGEGAAQAADVAILAKEAGLAEDDVRDAIAFQQSFAEYATSLIERYPDQISAVWTDPTPGQQGHVLFTGDVPSEVVAEIGHRIQSSGNNLATPTVTLSNGNVALRGGGLISMEEQTRRAELAAEALAHNGYGDAITFFDPVKNVTQVELQLSEGEELPSKSTLVSMVQTRIAAEQMPNGEARFQGRAAKVEPIDLDLTVFRGEGPLIEEQHTRGGNWIRDDGVRECTSGWSVRSWYGSYGFITAGHCSGINQFEQPGVRPYSAPFIRQVYGRRGDVEYHTTSHIELPEFYASATQIRSVRRIRPTNTMVGNSVCVYGRSSNIRTCNHRVLAVGITIVMDGRVTVGNLVRASNISTIGGDSGGGWSWGNTAWGVHNAVNWRNNWSYFTPIQQAQSALRVSVLTR